MSEFSKTKLPPSSPKSEEDQGNHSVPPSSKYRWPSKSQWRQFFKVLTKKERIIFSIFLFLGTVSLCFLLIDFYFKHTEIGPAVGGDYSEGLIGQPRFLNPIYSSINDVDRDLVEVLFSGLMKYSPEGELIPDLVEEYRVLEEGKVYEFYLKENILWEDGKPLTVDDIIFTIQTIQNPDFKSPLRVSWLGIEIEKISDKVLRFKLKKPSIVFLENCTVKIIPKHIWKSISPQNFPLAFYNLNPIGSGPYKLEELSQDDQGKIISLELVTNSEYFGRGPNIPKINFYFFDTEKDLIENYQRATIKGFALTSIENLANSDLDFNIYSFSLPRYFALFFNLEESKILEEEKVRKALNYATNKKELVKEILYEKGGVVHSPILPEIYGFNMPSEVYQFDLEKAKELLDETGFVENEEGKRVKIVKKTATFQLKSNLRLGSKGSEVQELQKCLAKFPDVYPEGEITGFFGQLTKLAVIRFQEKYKEEILAPFNLEKGTGEVKSKTRAKLNEVCYTQEEKIPFKFSLATVNQPLLVETAFLLKNQWEKLGAEILVETFDIAILEREIIKKRDYEALLFGEVLGALPDPFPFWHSTQKRDPGLNLALYSNSKVDELLEQNRQSLNEEIRKEKLEEFQEVLIEAAPGVFLYNPDYVYLVVSEIKGIKAGMIVDPSKRFSDIENWYIKTKRVLK